MNAGAKEANDRMWQNRVVTLLESISKRLPAYGPYEPAKKDPPSPSKPVELFPMEDVQGPGLPIPVVAAKKRGEWIIRGWCPFQTPENVQKEMLPYTGTDGIEWTTHTYRVPAYWIYGSRDDGGDLKGWGWPVGIYKFPFTGHLKEPWPCDTYRGKIECLREGFINGNWLSGR